MVTNKENQENAKIKNQNSGYYWGLGRGMIKEEHTGLLRSINQKLKTDITSSICITENLITKLLTWVMQELRKQIKESEVGQELSKAGTIIISGPKRKKGEVVLPEPRMEPLGPDQEPWRIHSHCQGSYPRLGGWEGGYTLASPFLLPSNLLPWFALT